MGTLRPSSNGALASIIHSRSAAPNPNEAAATSGTAAIQGNRGASAYAPEPTRRLAADLIETTLTEAGRHFSDIPRGADEIEAYASAMSDMSCAYLTALGRS